MDAVQAIDKMIGYLRKGNEFEKYAARILSSCPVHAEVGDSDWGASLTLKVECSRPEYDLLKDNNSTVRKSITSCIFTVLEGNFHMMELGVKYNDEVVLEEIMDEAEFPLSMEQFLATIARVFAMQGKAKEVAVLAHCSARIVPVVEQYSHEEYTSHILYLQVPAHLYSQLNDTRESSEHEILECAKQITKPYPQVNFFRVQIVPLVEGKPDWRIKAQRHLAEVGPTNQGRVHSDNLASIEVDGLLFRSDEEINLYRALKDVGIVFAPLPVFLKGGQTYKRIEPDFVVLKDGVFMIVEVDGDTVHRETPAEAETRTEMMKLAGAEILHVRATDCRTPEQAKECSKRLMDMLKQLKANRR